MKSWRDIGFEIEMTGDGSPSLRLLESVDPEKYVGESMHHSGGACSETNLIYGIPVQKILKEKSAVCFMIVGLGLGYIELVIAREALLLSENALQAFSRVGMITSYESCPELREFFVQWLHGHHNLHPEVQKTYEQVLEQILRGVNLTPQAVKDFLVRYFRVAEDVRGSLNSETLFESRYHCILYDAFSSKTTPTLWSEEFLNALLGIAAADECILSTYACRGSLKRALKNNNFQVTVREGFQGKRNSTLGERKSYS